MTTFPEYDIYQNQLLITQVKRGKETIAWYGVRINNKVGLLEHPELEAKLFNFRERIWGRVSYYIPIPKDLQNDDLIVFELWNIGKKPVYTADMRMEFWQTAKGD